MKRRDFLVQSAIFSAGCFAASTVPAFGVNAGNAKDIRLDTDLYKLFKNPESKYRPFVRWWWNGDKVEAKELVRE